MAVWAFFDAAFGMRESFAAPRGVCAGLAAMGADPRTAPAWEASNTRLLERLECHLDVHDFALGGLPVIAVFFEETWPVLVSTLDVLAADLASGQHAPGGELPGKTFAPSPGFEALQTGDGLLTHAVGIGGMRARRMVLPYPVWLLQRLAHAMRGAARGELESLLRAFPKGAELFELDARLARCRVRKQGGRLFSCPP